MDDVVINILNCPRCVEPMMAILDDWWCLQCQTLVRQEATPAGSPWER